MNPPLILIIDDDPLQRKLLKIHLDDLGFQVILAEDGRQGLEQARQSPPDAIVSDVLMPELDGFRFCLEVRKDPRLARIPVILISAAYTDRADQELAESVGASALVLRTPDFGEVIAALKSKLDSTPAPAAIAPAELPTEQYLTRVVQQLERKLYENTQLTERLQQLAEVVEFSEDAITSWTPEGIITSWNRGAERLYGYRAEEVIGKSMRLLLPPKSRHEFPLLLEALRRGEYIEQYETVRVRKDGCRIHVSLTSSPIKNAQGEITGASVVARDITARLHAEEALRESEERFRATFEQAAVGIAHIGLDGTWLRVNKRLCEIVDYTREELLSANFRIITHPDDQETDQGYIRQMLDDAIQNYSIEKRFIRKDDTIVWIDLTVSLARNASGTPEYFIAVIEDMTERKRLEAQFLQAQKMEGIGRLAGGVAHDFNNLLAAIMGYTELAAMKLPADDLALTDLHQIEVAAERAAELTSQLLAFARKQMIEPRVIDLNDLILNLDRMLRRLIGEDIELVTLPHTDLGSVKVDPGQFEQVLINLAVNARDAMPQGGRLTIETANVTFDQDYAHGHVDVAPGDYVMLAVTDTGVGMNAEIQKHIFEPFFTTKEKEKGTGLGLATCYGVVKQSGGHIWLYSEPGQGTTFKIYLPRVSEGAAAPETLREALPPRGTETILLVEDEPLVRGFAVEALRTQGYRVLEASHGEEALRIASEFPEEIALLLTDVVMPQMSGKILAEHLKQSRPQLKVLYVSGYTDNTIVRHGVLDAGITFLQKPYTLSALARKVRAVLAGGG